MRALRGNLRQDDFIKNNRLDATQSFLSTLESGKSPGAPSMKLLKQISENTKTSLSYLILGDEAEMYEARFGIKSGNQA